MNSDAICTRSSAADGAHREHLVGRTMLVGACALLAGILHLSQSHAQGGEGAAVTQAIEDLRTAMLAGDRTALDGLVADQLSYGHSGGVVESKAQFVEVIADKKTIYKSITLADPTVVVVGNNAIARTFFQRRPKAGARPLRRASV